MQGKLKDETGNRFGMLVVESRAPSTEKQCAMWNCKCDCGGNIVVSGGALRSENNKSCGCMIKTSKYRTHGKTRSRAYSIWKMMKQRCCNPTTGTFKWYGGRGITVCQEWMRFENFYRDMGDPPEKYTLERIDVNGNYEISNCEWIPFSDQAKNTTRTVYVDVYGVRMTKANAAVLLGISEAAIRSRLKYSGSIYGKKRSTAYATKAVVDRWRGRDNA